MHIYDGSNPPADLAIRTVTSILDEKPVRLAFCGPSGSGKSTLARHLGPAINHADPIKAEIVDFLAGPRDYAAFARFLGFTSATARDVDYLIRPVFLALPNLRAPKLATLEEKVAFVDGRQAQFRSCLQLYAEMMKEICADPLFWVSQTVSRGTSNRSLNADTRTPLEAEVLAYCGWSTVYINTPESVRRARRPQMTAQEWSRDYAGPLTCDVVINGDQPIGKMLMDLADYLGA